MQFFKFYYSLIITIPYNFGDTLWSYIVSQKEGSAFYRQRFSLFSLCFMTELLASCFPTGHWFDSNFITFWHNVCLADRRAEKNAKYCTIQRYLTFSWVTDLTLYCLQYFSAYKQWMFPNLIGLNMFLGLSIGVVWRTMYIQWCMRYARCTSIVFYGNVCLWIKILSLCKNKL